MIGLVPLLDTGRDLIEDPADVDTERRHGEQTDDCDQCDHQAVLDHRGSVFTTEKFAG